MEIQPTKKQDSQLRCYQMATGQLFLAILLGQKAKPPLLVQKVPCGDGLAFGDVLDVVSAFVMHYSRLHYYSAKIFEMVERSEAMGCCGLLWGKSWRLMASRKA